MISFKLIRRGEWVMPHRYEDIATFCHVCGKADMLEREFVAFEPLFKMHGLRIEWVNE